MLKIFHLPLVAVLSVFIASCSSNSEPAESGAETTTDGIGSTDASDGAGTSTATSGDSSTEAGTTAAGGADTATTGDTSGETGTAGTQSTGTGTTDTGSDTSTTTGGIATDGDPNAIGLSERAALADLNLPLEGARVGDFKLVDAYPNFPDRSFVDALLVDDVPGEERLVVVEQHGPIKVFDDNPAASTFKEILNYSSKLANAGEQGLLGLAFDPRFTENRFVYIYHTEKDTFTSVITRLRWDSASDVLDEASAKIVMRVEQPYKSHNGGMMTFGTDNYLYIALGDGGDGGDPQNNGQDRSTLLGSIIRIDVNTPDDSVGYLVPPSNPFVGEENVRPEIYAYGFRNPWRFSFDRVTGDMWVGDVGQGRHEEINIVKAGGNYGWRVYEGSTINKPSLNTLPESAFTPPVHEYTHDLGMAVIGGYVYRGSVSALQGRYIYADNTGSTVTALTMNGESVVSVDQVGQVISPSSFGETRDGELLVVSRNDGLFKFAENNASLSFPTKLSETGLFSDLASLTPASGIIEYVPSHPFWSDGTIKRRWIGVPDREKIKFTSDDWTFPTGSVSVKHFELEQVQNTPSSRRRLETRVMYHTRQGWQGYTYRWNAGGTDATLLTERETEQLSVQLNDGSTRTQQYDYPSPTDCSACHNDASTHLLGLETAQINAYFDYPAASANQLKTMNSIGLFDYDIGAIDQYKTLPPLGDNSASIEQRARAYLDVNCSTCHQPGGSAPSDMNFRVSVSNAGLNAIDATPEVGSFDIVDARIIASGAKERSVLWHRMRLLDEGRMPPLSTHVVDEVGVKLIGEWIDSL